jgi:hypothetical protein
MLEEWKVYEDGDYNFIVSSLGGIKNGNTGKALYKRKDKNGYVTVRMSRGAKDKTFKAHRLVLLTFLPNPSELPYVNHLNGIKDDNRLINLEWCTQKQNVRHAFNTGLITMKGSDNPKSIVSEDLVHEICQWFQSNPTLGPKAASSLFNTTLKVLTKIRCGESWKDIRCLYTIPPLTNRAKFID